MTSVTTRIYSAPLKWKKFMNPEIENKRWLVEQRDCFTTHLLSENGTTARRRAAEADNNVHAASLLNHRSLLIPKRLHNVMILNSPCSVGGCETRSTGNWKSEDWMTMLQGAMLWIFILRAQDHLREVAFDSVMTDGMLFRTRSRDIHL